MHRNDFLTAKNAVLIGLLLVASIFVGIALAEQMRINDRAAQPSVTSHSVIVTGPVCEEDAAIVGFGEYTAGFGYEYYKCIPMDDLPLPEWPN